MTEDYFQKHNTFLSNPLLSVIMMMTFRDHLEIPDRLTVFYRYAYNTLYTRHDALKGYSRERALDIEQFSKLFGVFSTLSYLQDKYEFTDDELQQLISNSKDMLNIDMANENILQDFCESVNLFYKDRLKYTFIHRSFQEYFTASAIVRDLRNVITTIMKMIRTRPHDRLIQMAHEFDSRTMMNYYFQPEYEKNLKSAPKTWNIKYPYKIVSELEMSFTSVHFSFTKDSIPQFIVISEKFDFAITAIRNLGIQSEDDVFKAYQLDTSKYRLILVFGGWGRLARALAVPSVH